MRLHLRILMSTSSLTIYTTLVFFHFLNQMLAIFEVFLTIFTFEKALENGEGLILKVIGQVDGQLIAIEKFHCHDP